MKLQLVLFVLLGVVTHLVQAQEAAPSLPTCAISCMTTYLPQSSCSPKDQPCICTDVDLQQALAACVESNCTVKESLITANIAAQTCGLPIHNEQSLLRNVTIPFMVVITLFLLARTMARLPFFGGELGSDDYVMFVAYFLALCFDVLLLMLASAGLGKDIWNIPFSQPYDEVTYTFQLFASFEKIYILTIWLTKISMLLLYLRIFLDSKFRTHVKLCISFCATAVFCLFFACLFRCWPISFSWTGWDGEHEGRCSSQQAQGWANAGLNIFADLAVLVLPLPTIWKMNASKGKRIAIMFMFGVGISITIVSVVRLYFLKIVNLSINPTFDLVNISLWSAIEVNTGIICACLPGARNFYSRIILGKIMSRGRFATRTGSDHSKSASASTLMSQIQFQRSKSMVSNSTTLCEAGLPDMKQYILVVKDVNVDVEAMNLEDGSEDGLSIERRDQFQVWSSRNPR